MAIQITFPDGNVKAFDAPPTGLAIATGISPGLAKKAVVVRVNGELWDLNRPIDRDAAFEIVTRDKPEALEVIRHDAAHVLAQAVQELFPGTQVTFGPSTEHGFYYDFARDVPFTDADLATIELGDRDNLGAGARVQRHRQESQACHQRGHQLVAGALLGVGLRAHILGELLPWRRRRSCHLGVSQIEFLEHLVDICLLAQKHPLTLAITLDSDAAIVMRNFALGPVP